MIGMVGVIRLEEAVTTRTMLVEKGRDCCCVDELR